MLSFLDSCDGGSPGLQDDVPNIPLVLSVQEFGELRRRGQDSTERLLDPVIG